jgi:peptidoglycan-N-acetylglucosamine deacetylase
MKRLNVILLVTGFLMAVEAGYSRTIDPNYQVGTWQGFRTCAITYTFDDGCPYQYTKAIPMFNEFGYKLTMNTVTSPTWYEPTHWDQLQTAATAGHEIASHTVTHPTLTPANEVAELSNSKTTINANITPQQCFTVAYPYCVESTESVIATYYIAGRTCSGAIVPATPSNFYQISSFVLGSSGTNTTSGINAIANSAASSGGWAVYLIHGIDGDGGYSPLSSTILRATLDYLHANPSKFWVSSFSNVVRYIKERNDVNVIEVSNDGNTITAQVTDSLSNTIYNYPVTIRRRLPSGWQAATVTQNGQPVDSNIVEVNSIKYVMFDAVPDGGDIVLNILIVPPVPPVAQDVNTSTLTDTPVSITLAATDDGLPNPPGVLSYIIASLPANGTLSDPCAGSINSVPYTLAGNGRQVIYTPVTGYGGADNFTFKANDSGVPPEGGDSNTAAVSITIRCVITATAGPNGSISPSGTLIRNAGSSILFTATFSTGYYIDKWYVDSNVVQTGGNTYTLANIATNHIVYVTFAALPQYTITAAAGEHGHIEPAGAMMVYQGDDKTLTATADPCYIIGTWFVDGNSVQVAGATYTLYNIQAGHEVLVTFLLPPVAFYVDANSPNDPGTGTQSDPLRRLQDGINAVQNSNAEVWVVAGTYKPTAGSDRTISFVVNPNVAVYGGFAGTETQRQQRNWAAHPTILSGDIGIADNNSDNSFTVVVGNSNSILDGFTITGGNANDTVGLSLYGGGIYNQAGDMTIANCKITANSAIVGGGVYNAGGTPKITNCTFSENTAGDGGGVYNSWANPVIVNCSFVKNSSSNGGGIYDIGCNEAIVDCVFIQNSADYGGSMFEFYNTLTISNSTFNGNISANGAVLACNSEEQAFPGSLTMANCIIWNGPEWLWNNDSTTISINYSDVNGGWTGTGNKNTDPLFMGADDYRLQTNSSCVDAGNNNSVPADITDIDGDGNTTEPIPFDIAGNPRIADGNGDGVAVVDMGAYERCGPIGADFTGDCIVNFEDFAIMAQEWQTAGIRADIYPKNSPDGIVDIMDLAVLAEEWLK